MDSNSEEVEDEDICEAEVSESPSERLPEILSALYKVVSQTEEGCITAKCNYCFGGKGLIRGKVTETGNFYKHMRRKHAAEFVKFEKKKSLPRPIFKSASSKKGSGNTSNQNPFTAAAAGKKNTHTVSAAKLQNLIIDYISSEMRPLVTVEKPAFRTLIFELSGQKPPARNTLTARIKTRFTEVVRTIKDRFDSAKFACTTADIWSANNRSYMGVTGHVIDQATLLRESYTLACRRMKFAHTHREIGEILSQIHTEFNLESPKLVATVTDNASNFGKAFKIFSVTTDPVHDRVEQDEDTNFLIDPNQAELNIEVIPDDLTGHIDNSIDDDDEHEQISSLPKQYRCCSHTLNLIATTNADQAKVNKVYKKHYNSAFAKCCAIWNTVHRSTKASDIVEEICHGKLKVPCPTRWNSSYDAIKKLLSFKEHLPIICEKLQKPKFKVTEIEFLEEYAKIMEPLSISLDCLQGEKQCYLGYILPTLFQLKKTLSNFTHLKFCSPLKDALIKGIEDRYKEVLDLNSFESKPYILATISIPMFKLKWLAITDQIGSYDLCKNLFMCEVQKEQVEEGSNVDDSSNDGEAENDTFFQFLKQSSTSTSSHLIDTPNNQDQMQCLSYLQDKSKDIQSLHKYPLIKSIFLRFNTILPSSAPVERAFSTGGQILTPRRNRLTDDMFERLLVLKSMGHI